MWQSLKRMFRKLTPLEMATHELAEAELSKLEAETGQEFAASLVSYNTARIRRLRLYITKLAEENPK